jgi:hypothetical protein
MPFDGMAIGGNLGRSPRRHAPRAGVDRRRRCPSACRGTCSASATSRHPRRGGARRRHLRLRRADAQRPHGHRARPRRRRRRAPPRGFRLNLKNAAFARDERPLEAGVRLRHLPRFSRAYLRHLLKAGESLGPQLLTVHNLRFMERLMAELRAAIEAGRLEACVLAWLGHDPTLAAAVLGDAKV